jgi:hypothetical protein
MTTNTQILLPTTVYGSPAGNYDGSSQDWYGDAVPAADYYRGRGGLQTAFFRVTGFDGTMTLEATLDSLTENAAWFTVYTYGGSSPLTDYHPASILGNFVWMRVRVTGFDAGTIESVTLTY